VSFSQRFLSKLSDGELKSIKEQLGTRVKIVLFAVTHD